MELQKIRQTALALTVLLLMPCALIAHDLWMIVDSPVPKIGERVNVKVTVGHNFPDGKLLAMADHLKVNLIAPDGKTSPLATTQNGTYQVASFTAQTAGAYMIAADYPYYSTRTKQGSVNKPKNEVAQPSESTTYVSRCSKTIVGAGGTAMLKPAGLNLEIVPQVDPATIKPGGMLPVQILYKGKPLAPSRDEEVDVKAVYAGFQTDEDTFAFAGHTDENGMCRIKVTQPGVWMVLVEKRVPAADKTKADTELYSGTLVFRIGE